MQSRLISFALDFSSYLLQKVKSPESVTHILLFGSIARGDAKEESDIDLFIDVVEGKKNWEKEIEAIQESFYQSVKYTRYWESLGIQNSFNITVGVLEKWKELHMSLAADALVLYGKYAPQQTKKREVQVLFYWENISNASTRVSLFRKLFGFQRYTQRYVGMLEEYKGKRLTKGCILVSLEDAQLFQGVFRSYKVPVRMKYIQEYEV